MCGYGDIEFDTVLMGVSLVSGHTTHQVPQLAIVNFLAIFNVTVKIRYFLHYQHNGEGRKGGCSSELPPPIHRACYSSPLWSTHRWAKNYASANLQLVGQAISTDNHKCYKEIGKSEILNVWDWGVFFTPVPYTVFGTRKSKPRSISELEVILFRKNLHMYRFLACEIRSRYPFCTRGSINGVSVHAQ